MPRERKRKTQVNVRRAVKAARRRSAPSRAARQARRPGRRRSRTPRSARAPPRAGRSSALPPEVSGVGRRGGSAALLSYIRSSATFIRSSSVCRLADRRRFRCWRRGRTLGPSTPRPASDRAIANSASKVFMRSSSAAGDDHGEFVAADARYLVVTPDGRDKRVSCAADQFVAAGVSVDRVRCLQTVDVDERDPSWSSVGGCSIDRGCEFFLEGEEIRHAGQRVGQGEATGAQLGGQRDVTVARDQQRHRPEHERSSRSRSRRSRCRRPAEVVDKRRPHHDGADRDLAERCGWRHEERAVEDEHREQPGVRAGGTAGGRDECTRRDPAGGDR